MLAGTLFLLTLLAAPRPAAPSEEELTVRIRPALCREYRPGAWILMHVAFDMPADASGVYRPALVLASQGRAAFVSRLPALPLEEAQSYHLSFWVMAGDQAPEIWLELAAQTPGRSWRSEPLREILSPLLVKAATAGHEADATLGRLILAPETLGPSRPYLADLLPEQATLYESADVLVLGHLSGRPLKPALRPAQLQAIAHWIARGGIALLLDESIQASLARTATLAGIRPGAPFPLVLPRPRPLTERQENPLACRLGRGLMIDLTHLDPGARARLGDAVWQRLSRAREYLPAPLTDLRLQKRRYEALGTAWPPPPVPPAASLARWILAWLLCGTALAVLPVVRVSPWRTSGALLLLSILGAVVFGRTHAIAAARIVSAQVRMIGETGTRGPTLDEELWFATPFATARPGSPELVIPFHELPPPRLLAYEPGEIERLTLVLDLDRTQGTLRVLPTAEPLPAFRRGVPLLFARSRIGDALPIPNLVLEERGRTLALVMPDPLDRPLHDAVLRTRACTLFLPRFDGTALADARAFTATRRDSAREQILTFLMGEHRPRAYATLMGWEEADCNADAPGTLRIYGLTNVLRPEGAAP